MSWGRTALVVGGISTGVSLIVAINVINTSVLANFRDTIELVAGPAALEVTLGTGEIGFPEATADIVRADPDVAATVPLVRGTVALAADPAQTLQLFGADLTTEEDLERYRITVNTDRTAFLEGLGYRVLRFWDNEALSNTDGMLERIAQQLNLTHRHPSPRPSPQRGEGEER